MKKKFDIQPLIRKNILALAPYSSARDEFADFNTEMIFLDANENPFQTNVNRYPDPWQRDVKTILAEQKGLKTENILLGNGSDEVLDLLIRAFCEPKLDHIITLPPTYGMYKVLSGINDVENIEIPLNSEFQPKVSEILRITNANSKLLFICSPNNPTGNSFSDKRIKSILENFSGLVVIDEAYIDFSNKPSWLEMLSTYPNLIITQTMSKAYGMAGIRMGICYASSEIISVLNKIKPPYNINELTQKRALERLRDTTSLKNEINLVISEKSNLLKVLLQFKFVKNVFQSDANFILVKVDDAALRYQQLLERGIVVRNRSSQILCENTLRFTVGTPDENAQLIATLKTMK
ncbi:MAG: histidinol-phosphate transaminase [Bacteroidota bacterium]